MAREQKAQIRFLFPDRLTVDCHPVKMEVIVRINFWEPSPSNSARSECLSYKEEVGGLNPSLGTILADLVQRKYRRPISDR